jgi:hypothetical protein
MVNIEVVVEGVPRNLGADVKKDGEGCPPPIYPPLRTSQANLPHV